MLARFLGGGGGGVFGVDTAPSVWPVSILPTRLGPGSICVCVGGEGRRSQSAQINAVISQRLFSCHPRLLFLAESSEAEGMFSAAAISCNWKCFVNISQRFGRATLSRDLLPPLLFRQTLQLSQGRGWSFPIPSFQITHTPYTMGLF